LVKIVKEMVMASSKSYQTVVAGRVREDECIEMFRENLVALPTGRKAIRSSGGSKLTQMPQESTAGDDKVIVVDHLADVQIGKDPSLRDPDLRPYNGDYVIGT
jgi:hypothetical protein